MSFGALVASSLPLPALAAVSQKMSPKRSLSFYNTHTRETIEVCYYDQGEYCPDALNKINRVLRDHRSNEVHTIDVQLLDRLYALKLKVRPRTPFHIISGYRSPSTNAKLRKSTSGVARRSYHTRGKAIDIRLPGYSTRRLRDACVSMKIGGVGYYPDSNFVHLDTGPVRSW